MQTETRPTDTDPTTPGGASARPWHPQALAGCRSCGNGERPHFARGLCEHCYYEIRAEGGLDAFLPLTTSNGWEISPRHNTVYHNHQECHARAWEQQRAIHAVAWQDGPWLTEANCREVPLPPRPRRAEPAAAPATPARQQVAGSGATYATVEERRAAQLRWAEEDKRRRRNATPVKNRDWSKYRQSA